jgi:folate-dependent phosphoribosylglycinamide formyltransferase PurN
VVRDVVDAEGNSLDAQYDPEAPIILVKHVDHAARMQMTLHHELLHVCFAAHSGDARQAALGPRTHEGRARREEAIVSFIEPVQFDLLVRNGWLKYPKPPRLK